MAVISKYTREIDRGQIDAGGRINSAMNPARVLMYSADSQSFRSGATFRRDAWYALAKQVIQSNGESLADLLAPIEGRIYMRMSATFREYAYTHVANKPRAQPQCASDPQTAYYFTSICGGAYPDGSDECSLLLPFDFFLFFLTVPISGTTVITFLGYGILTTAFSLNEISAHAI